MPPEYTENVAAPTRRSNRLRAATSAPANSTTPHAEQAVPSSASAAAAAAAVTAAAVSAAATSRRARRMAAAGNPEVQPVVEPEAVIAAPAAVIAEVVASVASAAASAPAPAVSHETPKVVEPAAEPSGSAAESDADAFAAASEAFGFQPVDADSAVEIPVADEPVAAGVIAHVAPRRPRIARRVVAAGASLGVMGVAGLIAVSMTLPVSAVAAAQGGAPASLVADPTEAPASSKVSDDEIQAFVASSDVQDEAIVRSDAFSTVSMADVAAEEGIKFSQSLYTNDPEAAIQWPFKVGVAMSSGYGQRWGRLHAGIDLVPGAGAPIQAIADGTVRIATESGGAYGVTAYVDHVIDGQVVTSHYAHMQYGSLQVKPGQKIKVGDVIGKVGNTGRSYGAHLHFEIIINGSTVDPLPWMKRNAGRYEY
ncbi:M23 family metallopeptidase [Microbacterium esteraromaticum]|uniref:M23 family metallopeptidase n=1 Tax=Microbacterium esteraromaticum TaxID=57043 RepID=A0A7D8ALE6_9MICO|nr:M23 family metallopeptidase [Microbacterium esteraromaticum]QMU97367.1 M23 family metallopeptidase [Microbacterium esteraromaticum]